MSSSSHLPLSALACLALVVASPLAAQTFTVIGMPDTQRYSEQFPAVFNEHTQWVADNVTALDIRYVSHYGDVVQHGDRLNEWMVADTAMAALDRVGVPYGVTAGNHDITRSGSAGQPYIPDNYRNFFGPSRFVGKPWFRGASPSGMSSWQVFDGGGLQFLTLHVEVDAPMGELVWAQGVLNANRDKPVLFTTHRYMQDAEDYTGGVPLVPSGRYPEVWYAVEGIYTPDGTRSEDIWDWFVRRNPNILLVNCGHFHEEYRQSSRNVEGNVVHEVLADYQDDPNGGNGWLRIMRFDLQNNLIDVDSYSTHLDAFRSADESKFVLSVDFDRYYEEEPTVVLTQGIGGYAGTRDTWIEQANGSRQHGNESVLVVDDDTRNNIFNDRRGYGLIRFEGLFGEPGTGEVPAGVQIRRATLSLQVTNDIDNPLFDPDFYVHRVLRSWDESSTWNSLGGLGAGDLSARIATFRGDNDPNGDELRRIDVTSAVQAWSQGAPNYGFAILPETISGNDDGIGIASSELGNPLLRPTLEVVYALDCGYSGYGTGIGSANTMSLYGLGRPRIGGVVDVGLEGTSAPFAVTVVALAPSQFPFLGGTLLVDTSTTVLTGVLDLNAPSPFVLPVPIDASLVGASLYAQSFAPDNLVPGGIAMSNGLRIKLCR